MFSEAEDGGDRPSNWTQTAHYSLRNLLPLQEKLIFCLDELRRETPPLHRVWGFLRRRSELPVRRRRFCKTAVLRPYFLPNLKPLYPQFYFGSALLPLITGRKRENLFIFSPFHSKSHPPHPSHPTPTQNTHTIPLLPLSFSFVAVIIHFFIPQTR